MDCRVVIEVAVPVFEVETVDSAVRIAIAKTGELLTPDLSYVDITATPRACLHCGEKHDPAFVVADEAHVALDLEIKLFNVENERQAEGLAVSEIGQQLVDFSLEVGAVEVLNSDGEGNGAEDGEPDADGKRCFLTSKTCLSKQFRGPIFFSPGDVAGCDRQ